MDICCNYAHCVLGLIYAVPDKFRAVVETMADGPSVYSWNYCSGAFLLAVSTVKRSAFESDLSHIRYVFALRRAVVSAQNYIRWYSVNEALVVLLRVGFPLSGCRKC